MFRHVTHFVALALSLSLFGCGGGSSDKPSESEGQQAVIQAIEKNGNGTIKLVSFKKTDGKSIDMTHQYVMDFEVEIEFVTDATLSRQGMRAENFFYEAGKNSSKAGAKRKFPGWIRFSKAESGWRCAPNDVWLKED